MKSLYALVGTKFRGAEMIKLLASLPQGEPLELRREPTNQHDPRAIQVWARGHHIGYIKGNQNRGLSSRMDSAIDEAVPHEASGLTFGGRLAIDGGKQPMVEVDDDSIP